MENLSKASLIIFLIGILLLFFLTPTKPREISTYQELKQEELVSTTAKIILIKSINDFKIITLSNNLTATCNKCPLKPNQTITLIGKVSNYENKLQIEIEQIVKIK